MKNTDLVTLLIKVFGTTAVLMLLIMLACIATPHLAKIIDKRREKHGYITLDETDTDDENAPAVRGPYDASGDEEYDLNYKIYNEDIYGFGKKGISRRPKNGGKAPDDSEDRKD